MVSIEVVEGCQPASIAATATTHEEPPQVIAAVRRSGGSSLFAFSAPLSRPSPASGCQPGCEATADGPSWDSLPRELQVNVLVRVERDNRRWPSRRAVVACAGVCREWRRTLKEIVRQRGGMTSDGHVTFLADLKTPGPASRPACCFIRRCRKSGAFLLFLGMAPTEEDPGKFLMAAKKVGWRPSNQEFVFSTNPKVFSRASPTCLGTLRANLTATRFAAYEAETLPPSSRRRSPSSPSSPSSSKVHPGSQASPALSTPLDGGRSVLKKAPAAPSAPSWAAWRAGDRVVSRPDATVGAALGNHPPGGDDASSVEPEAPDGREDHEAWGASCAAAATAAVSAAVMSLPRLFHTPPVPEIPFNSTPAELQSTLASLAASDPAAFPPPLPLPLSAPAGDAAAQAAPAKAPPSASSALPAAASAPLPSVSVTYGVNVRSARGPRSIVCTVHRVPPPPAASGRQRDGRQRGPLQGSRSSRALTPERGAGRSSGSGGGSVGSRSPRPPPLYERRLSPARRGSAAPLAASASPGVPPLSPMQPLRGSASPALSSWEEQQDRLSPVPPLPPAASSLAMPQRPSPPPHLRPHARDVLSPDASRQGTVSAVQQSPTPRGSGLLGRPLRPEASPPAVSALALPSSLLGGAGAQPPPLVLSRCAIPVGAEGAFPEPAVAWTAGAAAAAPASASAAASAADGQAAGSGDAADGTAPTREAAEATPLTQPADAGNGLAEANGTTEETPAHATATDTTAISISSGTSSSSDPTGSAPAPRASASPSLPSRPSTRQGLSPRPSDARAPLSLPPPYAAAPAAVSGWHAGASPTTAVGRTLAASASAGGPSASAAWLVEIEEGQADRGEGEGEGEERWGAGGALEVMPASMVLCNKPPRWHDQLQCWCLNFRGRVTVPSVKNFQLIDAGSPGHNADKPVLLQFGKIGRDLFTMDFRHPLTAYQAFAVCVSSFDTKVACE